MPTTPFSPSWKKHEKGISSTNVDEALKSTDAFQAERTQELKTSKVARDWEVGRRREAQKNKRAWRTEKVMKENEPVLKMIKVLKEGGNFQENLQPAPGYIIVGVDFQEEKTDTGIYLPSEAANPNIGYVLAVGGTLLLNGNKVACPAQKHDKILFKRGAGLEMTIKSESCRFMQFSDILGVFTK